MCRWTLVYSDTHSANETAAFRILQVPVQWSAGTNLLFKNKIENRPSRGRLGTFNYNSDVGDHQSVRKPLSVSGAMTPPLVRGDVVTTTRRMARSGVRGRYVSYDVSSLTSRARRNTNRNNIIAVTARNGFTEIPGTFLRVPKVIRSKSAPTAGLQTRPSGYDGNRGDS